MKIDMDCIQKGYGRPISHTYICKTCGQTFKATCVGHLPKIFIECDKCKKAREENIMYENLELKIVNDFDINSLIQHLNYACVPTTVDSKPKLPSIKNVIFNDPATIVFWSDGTKTVVKAQNDELYDEEKGLAMAITKKALGNEGNYYETIKKWLPKKEEKIEKSDLLISLDEVIANMKNAAKITNELVSVCDKCKHQNSSKCCNCITNDITGEISNFEPKDVTDKYPCSCYKCQYGNTFSNEYPCNECITNTETGKKSHFKLRGANE